MTADIATLATQLARTKPTQTTAIEQSRAIAEVQAAVTVAQQCPRDMGRVWDEVRDACRRLVLAQRAFYAVPNRGNGPSVHLARAVIRIYGNSDYGVRELTRDDDAGRSEIQAFAWDQQANVRSTRTFQVPHQRMKTDPRGKATRVTLFDLGDVYLNNQNVGARAVRECIASILPTDLWEEAQRICKETVEKGDGRPLVDRIAQMVQVFADLGVSVAQLEARLGRKRIEWTGADIAQATVAYQSVTHGDAELGELFPPAQARVTGVEILGNPPPKVAPSDPAPKPEAPAPADPEPAQPADATLSDKTLRRMQALFKAKGFRESLARHAYIEQTLTLPADTVASSADLTDAQAARVIAALEVLPDA